MTFGYGEQIWNSILVTFSTRKFEMCWTEHLEWQVYDIQYPGWCDMLIYYTYSSKKDTPGGFLEDILWVQVCDLGTNLQRGQLSDDVWPWMLQCSREAWNCRQEATREDGRNSPHHMWQFWWRLEFWESEFPKAILLISLAMTWIPRLNL